MCFDRTHPCIHPITITVPWPKGVNKLNLANSNFTCWSETLYNVLTMAQPLIHHIKPNPNSYYIKPDPDNEPIAYTN